MNSAADLMGPILKIMMILLRAGALWMFFPVFGQGTIPRPVRMAGAVTLSVALLKTAGPHLPSWSLYAPPPTGDLVMFVVREFIVGAGMGLVARWIFGSVMASAQWAGMQMGFSTGGIIDPEFQSSDTSWAELNHWMALMIFFGIGGHLWLIQAIADSYTFDFSDIGARLMDPAIGGRFWAEIGTRFFTWMLRLAGPIVVVLLLLQGALGILSKFIPQINIWTVSIPVTICVGVLVLALLSPLYGEAIAQLFQVGNETNYLWLRAVGVR